MKKKKKQVSFAVGDTVKVHFKIKEGDKERTQTYEGIVIAFGGAGLRRTFKVRKISYGVGVERTFPIHSPKVEKVEVLHAGRVRRAKLYYLRGVKGSKASHFKTDNKKTLLVRQQMEALDAGAKEAAEQEAIETAASAQPAGETK
jgi:large subunit ribosomal protein L19